jgi:hypothetical protein
VSLSRRPDVRPLSPNLQVFCIGRSSTLNLHTNIVLDENQKPIAVQIPIDEFQRLEEVIENYGLSKLIDEVADDEQLTVHEAQSLYQTLKKNAER